MHARFPSRGGPRHGAGWWPVIVLLVGCVLAAGCGGLTNPKPTTAIITDTLVAWAINGTPGHLPAGYELADERVVQTDANLNFDIAFDIDSAGHAVIYPVRLLTDGSISTRHVGLQRVSQPYDSVTFGLRRGYQFDSAYKLGPGDGMLIVSNPLGCLADANPTLYGKFIIDSVNIATRTIHFRATTDPNCGYRSFKPGIPPF